MASRIPPLLDACLALPPETSQIVLSGVLGASTNWLVQRYLYAFLGRAASAPDADADADDENPHVLLVSFLRDFAFWKEGAARLGLDLEAAGRAGRFAFVDGLGGLFVAPPPPPGTTAGRDTGGRAGVRGLALQPGRQPVVSGRLGSVPVGGGASGLGGADWRRTLRSTRVADVQTEIETAVWSIQSRGGGGGFGRRDGEAGEAATAVTKEKKVVLVIDQLDFLLAATGTEGSALALQTMLLDLRERVHATILTLAADEPLVVSQTTTLEREHAGFVLSLAHEAELLLSLRLLDTGTAKDVSGVVRISRGGGEDLGREIEEREFLYHVGGDGGVRVFERGQ